MGVAYIKVNDIPSVSRLCSFVGRKVLSGNVEAVKGLYGSVWKESIPLIKTITLLQENITAVEIERNEENKYCTEYLYYWGMLCLGEQSTLIVKDLGTARACFEKIAGIIPGTDARLAYIELLRSQEPTKSDNNLERINVLREWAGKGDLFSRIVLAKIIFSHFLDNRADESSKFPIRILRLLELPCQKGHPVAIRFWNEALDYVNTVTCSVAGLRIEKAKIEASTLYDFESLQICK